MSKAPIMDDLGNIKIHGREELSLPIRFTEIDADGNTVDQDVSGSPMYFEIPGIVRLPLQNVPGYPAFKRLVVLSATIKKVPKNGANYIIRQEGGVAAEVRLDGRFEWYGWV